MEEAGGGTIVNVASVAGVAGVGSSIPYCASKAALINLTVTLARVLAPKIRVNTVAPGFITGRWLKGGLGDDYEAVKKNSEKRSPLGKVCEPEDVADAIMSFVTGSQLTTGQTLTVDGGMLIGPGLRYCRRTFERHSSGRRASPPRFATDAASRPRPTWRSASKT